MKGGERTGCVVAEEQQHFDSVGGRLEVRGDQWIRVVRTVAK